MKTLKNIMVKMPDGVKLATDIFLPGDGSGKYPTIHIRTPYVKKNSIDRLFNKEISPAEKTIDVFMYLEKGYAIAIQDCRGTGDSEGLYKPWLGDAEDGYEFVEWMAKQSWSNGKIGAIGSSNHGAVQLLTASMKPPHLTCIVPMGTSAGMPFFENGILNLAGTSIWYIQQAMNSAERGGMSAERMATMKAKFDKIKENMDEQFSWLPLKDIPFANVSEVDMELFFHEFLEYLDQPSHWTKIHNPANLQSIDVPTLLLTNWYDHLAKNVFDIYKTLKHHGTPTTQENLHLYVGPWRKYKGIDGTDEGLWDNGRNLSEVVLGWFDYWLKGIKNDFEKKPKIFLHTMGDVKWKYSESWPLPETKFTKYYLDSKKGANSINGDGKLTLIKPLSGVDKFDYDPMNPIETRSGVVINPNDSLRQSQEDVEKRIDNLIYSTGVLEEDVEITGPVTGHIWASSSAIDTDFTAKLVNVLPDGSTYNLVEGIIRAKFRNGLESPELLVSGAIYEYVINMSGVGIVFKKGHKIRIEIASSNFPKHDRNMNTGNKIGVDKEGVVAHQTIYHDEQHPSYISMPVIPHK